MRFFLALIIAQSLYANVNTNYSLRRCMQLPILGRAEEIEFFKVYEQIEAYLKESNWCHYRSNSDILTTLQRYRPNLDLHLENTEVLKNIAEKTKAGSLIRTKINSVSDGIELAMEVIGDNGKDAFFSEKILIKETDTARIAHSVINWLKIYEKTIPYEGRVTGISGQQFTMDIGEASGISVGSKIRIDRPTEKKNHPLLDDIVEWKAKAIGQGKVIHTAQFKSLVKITQYSGHQQFRPGDWVVLTQEGPKRREEQGQPRPSREQIKEGGRLGAISLGLKPGWGNDTTTTRRTPNGQRVVGPLLGPYFDGELWVTKNFLISMGLEHNIGSYQRPAGGGGLASLSLIQDILKFKLGYRFFPFNSFFGPRIGLYLGYGEYNYDLDIMVDKGTGHHRLKGFLLGVKGSLPFREDVRGFAKWDFLPSASYEEDTNIFGTSPDLVTSYQIEIGTSYQYLPRIAIDGSVEMTFNRAKFSGNSSFYFNEKSLRGGVTFTY